jgi:hypothetical protein
VALDAGIVDSVANSNLKNLADAPAFYQALAMGNATAAQQRQNDAAIAHQQAMNTILTMGVGAITNLMTSVDPSQAMGEVKLLQSNLADKLADFAAVASSLQTLVGSVTPLIQELAKVAGSTPPVTVYSPGHDVGGKPTG